MAPFYITVNNVQAVFMVYIGLQFLQSSSYPLRSFEYKSSEIGRVLTHQQMPGTVKTTGLCSNRVDKDRTVEYCNFEIIALSFSLL